MIEKIIKLTLGAKKVRDVTTGEIERLKASIGKTPYQANSCPALLRAMFNIAIRGGERPDNPARGGRKASSDTMKKSATTGFRPRK